VTRRDKALAIIVVLWGAAMVGLIIWFATHLKVTGTETYTNDAGHVALRATHGWDTGSLLLWAGLFTGLALVAGLVAWIALAPSGTPLSDTESDRAP